jgi:UDP-glucose 4-epimerase
MLCVATGHPAMEPTFAPVRKVNPVTRRLAATEKARDGIGFEAQISLEEGLAELVEWHTALIENTAEKVA